MSVHLSVLLQYLDDLLKPEQFQDYCPNGLQVEGRTQIQRIVSGVTASQALIDAAIKSKADAILVHHGFFWKGENPVLTGMRRRRMAALLAHDISLIAYHLPLDAHREFGNNARFGALMGIAGGPLAASENSSELVWRGTLPAPMAAGDLISKLAKLTGRQPLHIGNPEELVRDVAWCTGAAQGYIDTAVAAGVDMFITGEVSEQTVHVAREEGIHFIAAGHHATERYGVQAVGAHLEASLGIIHQYIDANNPV